MLYSLGISASLLLLNSVTSVNANENTVEVKSYDIVSLSQQQRDKVQTGMCQSKMKMSQNVGHYKCNDFQKIIALIGQNNVCY